MKEINCEMIVIDFLKSMVGNTIAHHILDASLPRYGMQNYDKIYSPATYHRNFCWLKNDPDLLKENGIELEQLVEGSGKVNQWKVNSIKEEQLVMAL